MADDNFLDNFASDMIEGDAGAVPEPKAADTPPTPPATPEKPSETPAEKPADKPQEQPRAQDGRFAPKEPVVAPEPAPAAPAAKPMVDPEQFKGYLDEREKRQKLEKELADDRAELARLRAAQQTPVKVPSVTEDPAAYEAHQRALVENAMTNSRFETSELIARQAHGDVIVQSAKDWAIAKGEEEKKRLGFSPFAIEYLKQQHPIEWAVKQQKRDAFISKITDEDEETFVKRRYAELTGGTQAPQTPAPAGTPQPAPATPPAPAPTRSLAHATAAGANASVATGEHVPFDALFKKQG